MKIHNHTQFIETIRTLIKLSRAPNHNLTPEERTALDAAADFMIIKNDEVYEDTRTEILRRHVDKGVEE